MGRPRHLNTAEYIDFQTPGLVTETLMDIAGASFNEAVELSVSGGSGHETEMQLISEHLQIGTTDTPGFAALDTYFKGTGRDLDKKIIADGKSLNGVSIDTLRNEGGEITDESFISELTTRGVAVAISERQAQNKAVKVNNIWRLHRNPNDTTGGFLPWARILTIDADASGIIQNPNPRRTLRTINISESVVVFPYLRLPHTARHRAADQ